MRILRTLGTLALCVMTLVGLTSCGSDAGADDDVGTVVADEWDAMSAGDRGDACFRWDLEGYDAFKADTDPAIVSAYARLLRAECER